MTKLYASTSADSLRVALHDHTTARPWLSYCSIWSCIYSCPVFTTDAISFYTQVSTEGDAFTMAFHDPIDAISWALEVQHKLLLLDWPDALLSHDDAKEESGPGAATNTQAAVFFRGLRVRMAVHTGTPDALQVCGPSCCDLCVVCSEYSSTMGMLGMGSG